MKLPIWFKYVFGAALIFPFLAFGAEAVAVAVEAVDPGQVAMQGDKFIEFLLQSIGGLKGLSALGIVGVVSQVVMKALQTPFLGKLAGKYRLMAVYALSLVGGVVALKMGGMPLLPALVHSNTLAAYSLLGHQAYKQFIVKRKEPKKT